MTIKKIQQPGWASIFSSNLSSSDAYRSLQFSAAALDSSDHLYIAARDIVQRRIQQWGVQSSGQASVVSRFAVNDPLTSGNPGIDFLQIRVAGARVYRLYRQGTELRLWVSSTAGTGSVSSRHYRFARAGYDWSTQPVNVLTGGADFIINSSGTELILALSQWGGNFIGTNTVIVRCSINLSTEEITAVSAHELVTTSVITGLFFPRLVSSFTDTGVYLVGLGQAGTQLDPTVLRIENSGVVTWARRINIGSVAPNATSGSGVVDYQQCKSIDIVNNEIWVWATRWRNDILADRRITLTRLGTDGTVINTYYYGRDSSNFRGVAYSDGQAVIIDQLERVSLFDITAVDLTTGPGRLGTVQIENLVLTEGTFQKALADSAGNFLLLGDLGEPAGSVPQEIFTTAVKLGSGFESFNATVGDWRFTPQTTIDYLATEQSVTNPAFTVNTIASGDFTVAAVTADDRTTNAFYLDTGDEITEFSSLPLTGFQSLSLVEIDREYNPRAANWAVFLKGQGDYLANELDLVPTDVAVDSLGNCYVLCNALSTAFAASLDWVVFKLNAKGQQQWVSVLGTVRSESASTTAKGRGFITCESDTNNLSVVFDYDPGLASVTFGDGLTQADLKRIAVFYLNRTTGAELERFDIYDNFNSGQSETVFDVDAHASSLAIYYRATNADYARISFLTTGGTYLRPFNPNERALTFQYGGNQNRINGIFISRLDSRFIFIIGREFANFFITKLQISDRSIVWVRTVSPANTQATTAAQSALDFREDADGSGYLTGWHINSSDWASQGGAAADYTLVVHKVSSAGLGQWTKMFKFSGGGQFTRADILCPSGVNYLYVVYDRGILKLDKTSGQYLDAKKFNSETFKSAVVDSQNNVVLLYSYVVSGINTPMILRINNQNIDGYFDSFYQDPLLTIESRYSNSSWDKILDVTVSASNSTGSQPFREDKTSQTTVSNTNASIATNRGSLFYVIKKYDLRTPLVNYGTPISLNNFYAGGQFVPAGTIGEYLNFVQPIPSSGAIGILNFYNSPNWLDITVTESGSLGFDLRAVALAAGWDGQQALRLQIPTGKVLSSNSIGTAALTVSGSFPSGVMVVNRGYIFGMGGAGGNSRSAGAAAGPAINIQANIIIDNYGVIAGGGGGGGAGYEWGWATGNGSTPGSGGASGFTPTVGGSALSGAVDQTAALGSTDVSKFSDLPSPAATREPGGTSYYNIGDSTYWFADYTGNNNQLVLNDTVLDEEDFIAVEESTWPVVIGGWIYERDLFDGFVNAPEGIYFRIRRISSVGSTDGVYETPGQSTFYQQGNIFGSPGGRGGEWGISGDNGHRAYNSGSYFHYNWLGYVGGAGGRATTVANNAYNVTWMNIGKIYGDYNEGFTNKKSRQLEDEPTQGPNYSFNVYAWNDTTRLIQWGGPGSSFYYPVEHAGATVYYYNDYIYTKGNFAATVSGQNLYFVSRKRVANRNIY